MSATFRSELVAAGIETYADTTADTSEGPASFMITDPDGNQIPSTSTSEPHLRPESRSNMLFEVSDRGDRR